MNDSGRRTFAPTVGVGVLGAGLAALAGHRPWASPDVSGETERALADVALTGGSAEYPVAGALGLVCLATWGVVLVTRGRVRRAVAALGVLAAMGTLASTVAGFVTVPDTVRSALADVALTDADVSRTWWWALTVLGALLALAAGVLAVRFAPRWPEMGRRYDAPGPSRPRRRSAEPERASETDLWRSLDSGHDPTA